MNSSHKTIFFCAAVIAASAALAVPASAVFAAQSPVSDALAGVAQCSGAAHRASSLEQAAMLAQPCLNAAAERYVSKASNASPAASWVTVSQGYVRPWAAGPVRTQIVVPGLRISVNAPAGAEARVESGLASILASRRGVLYGYSAEIMPARVREKILKGNAAAALKTLPSSARLSASAPQALSRLFDDAPAVNMPFAAARGASWASLSAHNGAVSPAVTASHTSFSASGVQALAHMLSAPAAEPSASSAALFLAVGSPAPASASAFEPAAEDFLQTFSAAALKEASARVKPAQYDQDPNQGGQNSQGQTPDYHHHPDRQPDYEPYTYGEAPYSQESMQPNDGWQPYVDIFGATLDKAGAWQTVPGQGTLTRGGSEVGTQGADYTLALTSSQSREVYRLYWRWLGRDCDPNDYTSCVHWRPEFEFFADHAEQGNASSVVLHIHFAHDKTLLPWVKETIGFSYAGGSINVDTSGGAFQYAVVGPTLNQQTGQASVTLIAGAPVLRAPEADKVHLSLENSGGKLLLEVSDDRASYYAGETIEVAVKIKKDSGHWWKPDHVVAEYKQNGPLRVTVDPSKPTRVLADLSYLGSGKFYIADWSFSRANSKISSADWMDEGRGSKVQY